MHIGPRPYTTTNLERRVFLERLAIYYRSLVLANAAVVINSLMLAFVLHTPENARTVFAWTTVTLLIAAYRFVTVIRYRRQTKEEREARSQSAYRDVLVGVTLSGTAWGMAGFLLFDLNDVLNLSFLSFVVAGMCAGSIVSLSAFFEAAATFLTLSLVPYILRLLYELNPDTTVMAAMVLLYLGLMLIFARRVNRTVVTGLEMTYLRSDAEATIERQALYDELTGLPNRRLLGDRLAQAVARSRRRARQAALLFLDLDFFKRINDSLGHAIGDELLVEVAGRIRTLLREEDTAARLGGDEFVVLLTELDGDVERAVSVIRRRGEEIRRAVEAPMYLSGNEVHITVSVGVSLLPGDTDNVDDLLTHADTAMYRAKEEGRNTLRFFVAEMQEALVRRLEMEKQLRTAIDTGAGLSLFLQPQYTREGRMCGAELLLRWRFEGAFIPPAEFIPVAEDSGLIYRLGDWVVDEACRLAALLREEIGDPDFSLAVNVSPRQFRQKAFTDKVLQAIERHALHPGVIELEVTENLLIDDVADTVAKMQRLRAEGVRFSIDDFGTGYSSLSYLKSLPLDRLKIDKSFVRDALQDPGDASIVRAIISVARTLEIDVIAEGVETAETRDFLIEAGCYRFQGYLYSLPVPVDAFFALDRGEPKKADEPPLLPGA